MHGVGVFVVFVAIAIASRCSSGLQIFDHLRACATARTCRPDHYRRSL